MKKILMLIIASGLVILVAEGTVFSSPGKAAPDNVPVVVAPDIVVGMQAGDGSVCVVYLEITGLDRPNPAAASAQADILHQLPDSTTLLLLGFGGLLYSRRKEEKIRPAYLPVI